MYESSPQSSAMAQSFLSTACILSCGCPDSPLTTSSPCCSCYLRLQPYSICIILLGQLYIYSCLNSITIHICILYSIYTGNLLLSLFVSITTTSNINISNTLYKTGEDWKILAIYQLKWLTKVNEWLNMGFLTPAQVSNYIKKHKWGPL